MVTIKDIAEAAGVSIGTVSNVINGKTHTPDLVARVEKAIEEMGYRPNEKARSLKVRSTHLIGVIINEMEEDGMPMFLGALERTLRAKEYSIIVKTTGMNAVLEYKCVEALIKQGVDGLIIATGSTDEYWRTVSQQYDRPLVLVNRYRSGAPAASLVNFDYEMATRHFFEWCRKKHYQCIHMMVGYRFIAEPLLKHLISRYPDLEIHYQVVSHCNEETGFQLTYDLLFNHPDTDVLFFSSEKMTFGAFSAAGLLHLNTKPAFICAKNVRCIEDVFFYDAVMDISHCNLGEMTADTLLSHIEKKDKTPVTKTIPAAFQPKNSDRHVALPRPDSKVKPVLHIASFDQESADLLRKTCEIYTQNTGVQIVVQSMDYCTLYDLTQDPEALKSQDIDIFLYDISWKDPLIKCGVLSDLTDLTKGLPLEEYVDDAIALCGKYDNRLFGLPFTTGTQMLLYQRDLFEDSSLKIQYQRMTGQELKVPETLEEYHQVLRFFTQEFNPKSPVKYGTLLMNQGNLYCSLELLNRLWTYDADIIENGQVNLNNPHLSEALEHYRETYQYANHDVTIGNWHDMVSEFQKGNVAMVSLYDTYVPALSDFRTSRVAGNIGYAHIPGSCPISGGWGIGVFSGSSKQSCAMEFMQWIGSTSYDTLFSTLSGRSNRKHFYSNNDLGYLYPWNNQVLDNYRLRRNCSFLSDPEHKNLSAIFYQHILGPAACDVITGKCSIEEAIERIQTETDKLYT